MKKGYSFSQILIYSGLLFAFLILPSITVFGQISNHVPSDNRGDVNYRRKSNIDANNVRATVFNFGFSGRTGSRPDEIAYEWPKNTNRIYVALIAIWKAGEVVDDAGSKIKIVDFPTFRQNPAGQSWNLEPVPGFLNPDAKSVARSDNPDSWPTSLQGGWRDKSSDVNDPGWVDSWNGFFGKNVFQADQEMFYRTSDDLYDRYNYTPDETDPSRGGLGLLMDVRALAWSQILINDVVFFVHDILNDGTKRIPKASFLIWLADIVGNDSQDDQPFVDLQSSIAFLTDADRIGDEAFGTDPVGLASIKYLETPGNEVDGIDNDGDADFFPDILNEIDGDPDTLVPIFVEEDFDRRSILPGDKVVLIDSLTFERRIVEYPQGGGTVVSLGQTIQLPPEGLFVIEDTLANSLDEDLDGLIDERLTLHLERFDEVTGTVRAVRYINYLSFDIGDTVKRGFIVPGKAAQYSYANLAPMIDESRDDGFDNDRDWSALQDDVGLDGVDPVDDQYTGADQGEGDGVPTTGSGKDFPGEPNIDKTDVSETDLIGLTSAVQDPAFGIDFNTVADGSIWNRFMTPGKFFLPRPTGEYDTFVSSGFFPLDPGKRQRMAISIAMAGGGINKQADLENAAQKQDQARTAFESDYQFAQAPIQPTLTAVPGNGKVTLYWDESSEDSEDRFIKRLGGPYEDFEGYRIYRATDAALLDAKVITNAQGILKLLRPIKQFDLDDGISGLHPIDIEGVKFDLGRDTGLQHSYIDTTVTNGQRYFYVITAYDFGYEFGNIAPSESPYNIDVDPQGEIKISKNVAVVRPREPVAGYLPAEVNELDHFLGSSTGVIGFEVVDPRAIFDGHEYEITFEDTLIRKLTGDVLTTKNFSLKNITFNDVIIEKNLMFNEGDEVPLVDGFRLSFVNEERVKLNEILSSWNDPTVYSFQFSIAQFLTVAGELRPADYQIIIGDIGIGTSKDTTILFYPLPEKQVNFKVINISENKEIQFAFAEIDGTDGQFSVNPNDANKTDTIFLLEDNIDGELAYTWQITLNTIPKDGRNPAPGDTLSVFLRKPFLSRDVYRFTVSGEGESKELAKQQLQNIRVVPNPYVGAASWEPRNTFSSGRGPREIHFINLPKECKVRIFNVNGVLIDTIEHDSELDNGTAIWDLLSKDGLAISYGLYVYHVEAPGIGDKTGNFAVIK